MQISNKKSLKLPTFEQWHSGTNENAMAQNPVQMIVQALQNPQTAQKLAGNQQLMTTISQALGIQLPQPAQQQPATGQQQPNPAAGQPQTGAPQAPQAAAPQAAAPRA